MLHKVSMISMITLLILVLVSCISFAADDTVNYFIQGAAPFAAPVINMFPEFEKETGIKVNVINAPPDQTLERVMIEATNNSGIYDLVIVNRPNFSLLQEAGLLQPLDGVISQELIDDLFPAHREFTTVDGHLYAVPHSNDVRFLFYRTDLFEEAGIDAPPSTWAELLEISKKLTNPRRNQFGLTIAAFGWSGMWTLSDFIIQAGGELIDSDAQPAFNSPEGLEALKFINKLWDTGVLPPGTTTYWWPNVGQAFAQGQAAMAIEFNDFIGLFNDPKQSRVVGKYDIAMIPAGPAGTATSNAGWLLGIPRGAKNVEGAVKLLEFILSTEAQMSMVLKSGTISPMQSVMEQLVASGEEGLSAADPNSKARWELYQDVVSTTYEMPKISGYTVYEVELARVLPEVLSKAKTPEQALSDAEAEIMSLLNE